MSIQHGGTHPFERTQIPLRTPNPVPIDQISAFLSCSVQRL